MPGGRPILYKPENADIARLACMLGATNDTLADRFEVSPRTVDNWIAAIPEFGDAGRQGRQVADESVVSALFARATGMERKVTKAFCHKGQPITVSYTVELPPDVRACMFWLRNRRPGQWRENRPLIDERDDLDFRGLEEASQRAALADRDKSPEAAPVRGGPDALPPPSVPPLRNCPLFHCLTFGVHYIRRRMRRHRSGALIGANFADISNDNLILRRPRSGRLEGWATHGVVEKAGLQRLLGCQPFETHRRGAPQGEVKVSVSAYDLPSSSAFSRWKSSTTAFITARTRGSALRSRCTRSHWSAKTSSMIPPTRFSIGSGSPR